MMVFVNIQYGSSVKLKIHDFPFLLTYKNNQLTVETCEDLKHNVLNFEFLTIIGSVNDDSLTVLGTEKLIRIQFPNKPYLIGNYCNNKLGLLIKVIASKYSDDFERLLFEEDNNKDVTFKVGANEIKAHKLILGARSEVFKIMFGTDMKEKLTNVIEVDDVTEEALKKFLEFIYCNKYQEEFVKELLYLSDKYDVDDLKTLTAETLFNKITNENAIETFILLDKHQAHEYKKKAGMFIADRCQKVYTTERKRNLQKTHPELSHFLEGLIYAYNYLKNNK